MAKKIVASVTLHVKDEKRFKPFEFGENGIAVGGTYAIKEVRPGTPVELDDEEADALIEAGRAELYAEPETVKAETKSGKA